MRARAASRACCGLSGVKLVSRVRSRTVAEESPLKYSPEKAAAMSAASFQAPVWNQVLVRTGGSWYSPLWSGRRLEGKVPLPTSSLKDSASLCST